MVFSATSATSVPDKTMTLIPQCTEVVTLERAELREGVKNANNVKYVWKI